MDNKKIRICIFIHYSTTASLPYYVQVYIEELSLYFDKVKVLSNNSKINKQDYSFNKNIDFNYFQNQGYDFGMFYRFIIKENLNNFSQIALVNDSNILINQLGNIFLWAKENNSDFWGLIDSNEKPWFSTHKDNYHIQSHFIVLNEKAINHLPDFFETINIDQLLKEKDLKKLRRQIINDWEIGLSQYFIKLKLEKALFIESKKMLVKYHPRKKNITHSLFSQLIAKEDYPLLKRKIATINKKWYQLSKNRWRETIRKHGYKHWDLEEIINIGD